MLIFPPHQKVHYFCFRVQPFGLCSAPFVFTKVFRPLVAYWRRNGIHIVVYLDDDLEEGPSYPVALAYSTRVKTDLVHSGFVLNLEKSVWALAQSLIGWVSPLICFRVCFLFRG